MPARDVIKFLVVSRLAGNAKVLNVVEMIAEGQTITEIANATGVKKSTIRYYKTLLYSHGLKGVRAYVVLSRVIPIIRRLEPVMVPISERFARCRLCGAVYVINPGMLSRHVASAHIDLVESLVEKVVDEVRNGLDGGGSGSDTA
jgi:uncharacterized protein YerC